MASTIAGQQQNCLICSGDAIVYRVLGATGRSDQGISLQEILDRIGQTKSLAWQYTKEFREQKTKTLIGFPVLIPSILCFFIRKTPD